MAEKLREHLRNKSQEHLHLKLLQSQWSFDEELIPKALQNVAAIFPHYSRHDASHSRQILINIERLLGDTLTSLTATDTWLLLEAAYWHDIGMVVTANDIVTDMQTVEFKHYVSEIASQRGHELQVFAQTFSSMDPRDCFSSAETPQQAYENYRQFLAGWYRIRHSGQVAEIIDDPWEKTGIASPRNELVPKRLFRLLGQICRSHGSSFGSTLESLPFCETGMATEDCHPRFVACLLRLGDLFDLDDNRFCPVMLRIAGIIPASTQAHIDKHLAITHFRLDPDRVEITAICKNYEAYEATDQWFRWIEDELRNQMTHWKDIVPNRLFGLLPTLGRLEVNLAPPHEILDPGQRPRFGVDPEQTIELLQGAGLYRDKWQSLRELLQNAIDATLIRIWLTHAENPDSNGKDIDWQNPLSPEVKRIFNLYPLEVRVFRLSKAESSRVSWQLDIRDKGIGISKQDLTFLRSVGSSCKNAERRLIIDRMPDWMRPSGAFGIGLQSAFLIADEVNFETISLLSGDSLKITMTSPLGLRRGIIYIQSHKKPPGRESGTLLSLVVESEAIPKQVTIKHEDSFVASILAEFDPVRMADIPYETAMMVDEIIKFSALSPLSIDLNFDGQFLELRKLDLRFDSSTKYFHAETGVMLVNHAFGSYERGRSSTIAFRGQRIDKYHPRVPFIIFLADILAEPAEKTLTINRNDIKEKVRRHIDQLLVDTITGYLGSKNCQALSPEEEHAASAFLLWYQRETARKDLENKWKNLMISETGLSITEMCKKNEFKLYLTGQQRTSIEKGLEDSWIVESHQALSPRYELLLKNWSDEKGFVQHELAADGNHSILHFSKETLPPFGDAYLKKRLLDQAKREYGMVGGRYSMPAWGKYEILSTDVVQLSWCFSLSDYHHYQNVFILPFFFAYRDKRVTTDGFDELCTWVMRHKLSHEVKISDIRAAYEEFINWVDYKVMAESVEWKTLRGIH